MILVSSSSNKLIGMEAVMAASKWPPEIYLTNKLELVDEKCLNL